MPVRIISVVVFVILSFQAYSQNVEKYKKYIKVWGYLKYNHPAFEKGKHSWNAIFVYDFNRLKTSLDESYVDQLLNERLQHLNEIRDPSKTKFNNELSVERDSLLTANYSVDWVYKEDYLSPDLSKLLQEVQVYRSNQTKNYNNKYVHSSYAVPVFKRDETQYTDTDRLEQPHYILALAKYWSAIEYYYPYKYLNGNWDDVLDSLLPVFMKIRTNNQYKTALSLLNASIHDSHAWMSFKSNFNWEYNGRFFPPFTYKVVSDTVVVYRVFDSKTKLKKGDMLLQCDDVDVHTMLKKCRPYYSCSNTERYQRLIGAFGTLFNGEDSSIHRQLTFVRKGDTLTTSFQSTYTLSTLPYGYWSVRGSHIKDMDSIRIGNVFYLNPSKFKRREGRKIKRIIKSLPSDMTLMIDYRLWSPHVFRIGKLVVPHRTRVAKFAYVSKKMPGMQEFREREESKVFRSTLFVGNTKDKLPFKGDVYIIVANSTQSSQEYSTMALQCGPNVKVIGETTAGADGNITSIELPGQVKMYFSGIGVYYPDGTPTQQVGIQIDYPIQKTVAGQLQPEDELLFKAMKMLKE